MIKTNIKMRVTPEQSKKVQEFCFKNGINWYVYLDDTPKYTNKPYILIDERKYLTWLGKNQNDRFMRAEEEEMDAELFIKTNGSCIEENQEFTYPMWFKNKNNGYIVRFDGLTVGEVVYAFENWVLDSNKSNNWTEHTNDSVWVQVENPNKDECKKDNSINNGGKTDYYQLKNAPFQINDFDDFAEWRGLNGSQFNMGKVMWTFNTGRHSGTDYERDLNKIIHYANRELLRLKRGEK